MARETADQEPFIPGSKGQLIAHPGYKLSRDAERDAQVFAESPLLTPQMRKRHDITVGEGKGELANVL
jgi:hypothetical protein